MPILTVQVNDAEGPVNGVEVIVQLAASDRLRAGGAQVTNDPIVRHTNMAGCGRPSTSTAPKNLSVRGCTPSVRGAKSRPVSFAMPSN